MANNSFKVAMGQLAVEPGNPEGNLRRAEQMIHDAAEAGCRIIVLPECLDLGWMDASMEQYAEPIPGARTERLMAAARHAGLFVVAGLTERDGDRLYNAAVLLGPDGTLLLSYRKINEIRFGAGFDRYAIGDRLGVVHTELGCIGVNICADNLQSSLALGHALARMGVQLILSPCAWAVPPTFDPLTTTYGAEWTTPYRELARLYELTVIGVSYVGPVASGPWAGWRCIGNSLAVGPGGEILAVGPHGIAAEQLIIVPVTLVERRQLGTDIAPVLAEHGYPGP